MTAKLPPSNCKYCGKVQQDARKLFCNPSCRNRLRRGTPVEKKYKPEPSLALAEVREWRRLVEFPNYEVSNDGRVRRAVAGTNKRVGDLLRCRLNDRGYPHYRLMRKDGRHLNVRAHRLVAFAFLAPPLPDQTQVRHLDDDKLHCISENLAWGTQQDNAEDRARNGNQWCGVNLSAAQVAGWQRKKNTRDGKAPT